MRKWNIRQKSVSYCKNTVLFVNVRKSENGVLCQQFEARHLVALGVICYVVTLLLHFFSSKCNRLSNQFC
jgi:hypothetical protein